MKSFFWRFLLLLSEVVSVSEPSQVEVVSWHGGVSALPCSLSLNTFIPVQRSELQTCRSHWREPTKSFLLPVWSLEREWLLLSLPFCLTQAPGTQLHGSRAGWICWGEGHTLGQQLPVPAPWYILCSYRHTQSWLLDHFIFGYRMYSVKELANPKHIPFPKKSLLSWAKSNFSLYAVIN